MQFKHPEILYALFLLLIPIIVHLFQLRRFEKVAFTNVEFLKQVELQTRKSSKLKKFLILCTRLLAFTGLIFAFAQPYLSTVKKDEVLNTYIYLDNSWSMQAKGANGELLKRAAQDIIKGYTTTKDVNLITNDKFLKGLMAEDLKRELLNLDYHAIPQDINTILFKIKNDLDQKSKAIHEIILVSDFQNVKTLELDSAHVYNLVQTKATRQSNMSIDSVYLADQTGENTSIEVVLKSHGAASDNLSISLHNGSVLQGKSSVSIDENESQTTTFTLSNQDDFMGRLSIDDSGLPSDNELYFSINRQDLINVLAIGDNNQFLNKIYTDDEFNFSGTSINQLDYSKLADQNLIILNELESIPASLTTALSEFIANEGSLVVIPHTNSDLKTYSSLYRSLRIGSIGTKNENSLAITNINFSHPVLRNVFEKQIKNFQYPTVSSQYRGQLAGATPILSFENESPFISQVKF